MTHYPPPSTLELYDSDPPIDLDGLLSLVDLSGCLLLASPSTHIRVHRLCAATAILSQPMQHQHHCTHARVTKQLFAGLAQGQFDYSAEIPIGGELQLVGIALITIKQRQTMLPQARYEAAITNKCHSFYVALIYSIVVVILVYFVHQAHMDVCLRRRYTYFSLALSLLLHPVCCNYSTALFIMVLILMMILMVCTYYSIVNPPARSTSSCIWRVTTSTTGRRTRPRIDAPEQRYSPVSISIRKEKMYVTCKLEDSAGRCSVVVWYCVWSSESQR